MKAEKNSGANPNPEMVMGLGQPGDAQLLCHLPALYHGCPSAKEGSVVPSFTTISKLAVGIAHVPAATYDEQLWLLQGSCSLARKC